MKPELIPNFLSVFRILLIPPAMYLLVTQRYYAATLVIALAVFTDGLDGYLARQYGWRTRLGGILDPLADKLLFVCVFLYLGLAGHIPAWVMVLVIARDLVIAAGALLYQRLIGPLVASPTLLSKINTVMLFFYTASVLLVLAGIPPATPATSRALEAVVVVTVIGSGLQYVWVWSRKALRESRA